MLIYLLNLTSQDLTQTADQGGTLILIQAHPHLAQGERRPTFAPGQRQRPDLRRLTGFQGIFQGADLVQRQGLFLSKKKRVK